MAGEVTQFVPQGRAGTSDAFVYDPTAVWQNKRRLDQIAANTQMQQARLAAQQQMLQDRQRAILDRQVTKPNDLGFYATAFDEFDEPWTQSYLNQPDQRAALGLMNERNRRVTAARSANSIVSNRLKEIERDPDFNKSAYLDVVTRNIAKRTMDENMSGSAYDGAAPLIETEKDHKVYDKAAMGARMMKRTGTNTFKIERPDGTGYEIKYSDISDKDGNLDIDRVKEIIRPDKKGWVFDKTVEEYRAKGAPDPEMAAAKEFFPSFSFSRKVDNKPAPLPKGAGGKPKEPNYASGVAPLEVQVYSAPTNKQALDKKDFTATPSQFQAISFGQTKTRIPKIPLAPGTQVTYLDNEPMRNEWMEGGRPKYQDRLPSGYSAVPPGVTDFTNISVTVLPRAKKDMVINGQKFNKLNVIPPDLLPYVSANDVQFVRGLVGTPVMLQEGGSTSRTTKGGYEMQATTRTTDKMSTPNTPGKTLFIEASRLPGTLEALRKDRPALDSELDQIEAGLKGRTMKSSGAKYFKPAAPATPAKPKQKSAVDF